MFRTIAVSSIALLAVTAAAQPTAQGHALPEPLQVTTSGGVTLAVSRYAGDGVPVVLLHGGPGFGDYMAPVAEMLSPPRLVISYDQRGCGKSSRHGSYHFREHVQDLEDIRKYLNVDKIHILGHSWGGLLAQMYAKEDPDRVASLVLCCAAANTGVKAEAMEGKAIGERIIGKAPLLPKLGWGILWVLPGLQDIGFRHLIGVLYPLYFVDPKQAPRFPGLANITNRGFAETNRSVAKADENYLEGISLPAPVMVIQGTQDVLHETHAVLMARFPEARNVWIDQAGHFAWLEQPQQFRDTVAQFYASQP